MSIRRPPIHVVVSLAAGLLALSQGGCMSALTTASLREVLLDTVDSLADATETDAVRAGTDADVSASLATDGAEGSPPLIAEPAKPLSLDEAVDLAVARLKAAGELDAATQATLLSILENTAPEDWPAAIDAFAASLAACRPTQTQPIPAPAPPAVVPVTVSEDAQGESLVFPETALAFPAMPSEAEPARLAVIEAARPVGPEPVPGPVAAATTPPPEVVEPLGAEEPLSGIGLPGVAEPSPVEQPSPPVRTSPALAVHNACFVSRVRGWGAVDRFPEAVFGPGQDVIVYFELESPSSRELAAGHATSIDTIFRLIAPDGRQLGQWDFEPVDEVCHAPRRDYFARYFVRIPEAAPAGPYRLEFVVTDLVAGISTQAHLDLVVR